MDIHQFKIENPEDTGQRIDKLLPEYHSEWSLTKIQDWIKAITVKVNDQVIKSNYKTK